MFILKDILFRLFGVEAKARDTFKDGNDKGIWERYNESLAEDYDEEVQPLITNVFDNVLVPDTMFVRFLDIQNEALGDLPVPSTDIVVRRKMIKYFNIIGIIKGTLKSFEMMYSFLGITVDVFTDINSLYGWDSPTTLDDDDRTFDNTNLCCGFYSMELSGSDPIDSELENAINIVNNYLKPLNSVVVEIKYNGLPITIE